ncbi:MAG: cytochrome c oxidase subunit II [Bacteroidetes bacterium]|nr:MAG: cytochrome c oxidase subunit II [Bacteroidota bacterium]
MFTEASNFAAGVDLAFKVIFGISIFLLVGITTVMLYFVIRYRRSKHPKAVQVKDNSALEITWTLIPLGIVILMFYYGYVAFSPQRVFPKDAMNVTVVAKMWVWSFIYPGEKESNMLVLPINKAVVLNLTSLDVIHSFYVPAFRQKEDCVPGKLNQMWFIPTLAGEYWVLCAEYCGVNHSYMEAKVKVVSQAEYDAWIAALPKKAAEPEGLSIIKKNACNGCHSIDGSRLVSTSFKGLYGKESIVVTDGKEHTVKVNDAYIKTSIYEPDKDVVKGLPKGVMKSYKGLISDEEVAKIIEYLKSIK